MASFAQRELDAETLDEFIRVLGQADGDQLARVRGLLDVPSESKVERMVDNGLDREFKRGEYDPDY